MEYWNNYHVVHKGINYGDCWKCYYLETVIKDNKTNYEIIYIRTYLEYKKTLVIEINTNEKMIKRLKIPYYKHHAEYSYIEDKKFIDSKDHKGKNIICVSLGAGNVGSILKDIIKYWKDNNYDIKSVIFDRETGNHVNTERNYQV